MKANKVEEVKKVEVKIPSDTEIAEAFRKPMEIAQRLQDLLKDCEVCEHGDVLEDCGMCKDFADREDRKNFESGEDCMFESDEDCKEEYRQSLTRNAVLAFIEQLTQMVPGFDIGDKPLPLIFDPPQGGR
jgi:hypothetical protein